MARTTFCSNMPTHVVCTLRDYHLFSNRTVTPNTPLGYVRAMCQRRRATTDDMASDLYPIEIVWDELDQIQQVLNITENSKIDGKSFQVTTSWS